MLLFCRSWLFILRLLFFVLHSLLFVFCLLLFIHRLSLFFCRFFISCLPLNVVLLQVVLSVLFVSVFRL